MPTVDVVPNTNKLTTDEVLLEKLTVPQAVKYFPPIFCNSNVHYRVQKSLSFEPILNHINPLQSHILSVKDPFQYYPSIYNKVFHIVFSFSFPHQNSVCTNSLPCTVHMPPPQPMQLDCSNCTIYR